MTPKQLLEVAPTLLDISIDGHYPNLLIYGKPGIGKSHTAEQLAKKMGADLILVHMVTVDPTDLRGLPCTVKDDKGNVTADWIPFGDLKQMIETKKKTIVFFDDFGQTTNMNQAAAMQIVEARRLNEIKISDTVRFIVATNSREDGAGVKGLLEPLKNRMCMVQLETDVEEWMEYIIRDQDCHSVAYSFAKFCHHEAKPLFDFKVSKEMDNNCTPRSLHRLGVVVKQFEDAGQAIPTEFISGFVGNSVGAEFTGFYRIFRELPDPDLVLQDPDKYDIPKKADVLFALMGAVAYRAKPATAENLVKFVDRLPTEYGVKMMKDILGTAQAGKQHFLVNTNGFTDWCVKHQDVMFDRAA